LIPKTAFNPQENVNVSSRVSGGWSKETKIEAKKRVEISTYEFLTGALSGFYSGFSLLFLL